MHQVSLFGRSLRWWVVAVEFEVFQGPKDASCWVRMVIEWLGNNTNCLLSIWWLLINRATKWLPHNCQTQLPLQAPLFLSAQSLSKQFPCFGSPYPQLWYKRNLDHFRFFLEDMATAQKYCCVVSLWRNCLSKRGWYVAWQWCVDRLSQWLVNISLKA